MQSARYKVEEGKVVFVMNDEECKYYERTLRLLEGAYLEADARGDLAGGSGSGGGLVRWERKRRVIANAFDHDGTWLDVGCANGLLMETLTQWAAEKGVRIEPYGLELSARIAEHARERLPLWADRIWTGNVMTWEPLIRFDYVTVIHDCVPESRRADMLRRVMERFLSPHGRLVFSYYRPGKIGEPHRPDARSSAALLHDCELQPIGESEVRDDDANLWVSVAWLDK
jgi:SAM-dependent methyltransferase